MWTAQWRWQANRHAISCIAMTEAAGLLALALRSASASRAPPCRPASFSPTTGDRRQVLHTTTAGPVSTAVNIRISPEGLAAHAPQAVGRRYIAAPNGARRFPPNRLALR